MMEITVSVLLRTTGYTILAAGVALLLFRTGRIHSPTTHRIIWVMVLLQGWVFVPMVLTIPIKPPAPSEAVSDVFSVSERPSLGNSSSVQLSSDLSKPKPLANYRLWIAVLWIGGAAVIAFVWMRRYATMLHKIPLGRIPATDQWKTEWDSIARSSGTGNRAQFRLTDNIGPLCCFVPFFYLILAPEKLWSTLSGQQREAILKHELAHVRRRDLWKSAAIRILALPQWFNPLAWKAVRAFDDAAEWACDDAVMRAVGKGDQTAYSSALLHIAESNFTPIPSSVAARGGVLSTRIRRLVQSDIMEDTMMKKVLLTGLFLGLVVVHSIRIETIAAEQGQEREVHAEVAQHELDGISDDRKADLERTGLVPYRVASHDIILIGATGETEEKASTALSQEYLVEPDGTIDLKSVGHVYVDGNTVKEISDAINAKFADYGVATSVTVKMFGRNSKRVDVILKNSNGKDDFIFPVACTPQMDLLEALSLSKKSWPHPVDLDKAAIQLNRKTGENRAVSPPVRWCDISEGRRNIKLLPGDRIEVYRADPRPPAYAKESTTVAQPVSDNKDAKIKLSIQIIRDAEGHLEEFEDLKNGSFMKAQTKQILATLRILGRNKLIDYTGAPAITCNAGQEVYVASEGELFKGSNRTGEIDYSNKGIKITSTPSILEDSEGFKVLLKTEVRLRSDRGNLDVSTASLIAEGTTFIMRAQPRLNQKHEHHTQWYDAIYVVITPELVK